MNQLRPGAITLLVGGVVLFIATFLDWNSFGGGGFSVSFNAWDFGLMGLFLAVIAVIAVVVALVPTFAPQVSLPSNILSFSTAQFTLVLGVSATIIAFSRLFNTDGFQIGSILATLAGAAIVAGAHMEAAAGGSEPTRTI